MSDKRSLDPSLLAPTDGYKLMIGVVVPRPIGWIGTRDTNGVANLAPYSFFNGVAATPPTVVFSTIRPDGRAKDTLANVLATGEFTVNTVDESVVEQMNLTSGPYDPEVDELSLAKLTPLAGEVVGAPLVAESPANMECRLIDAIDVGRLPMAGTIVIGEVVRFHIRADLLDGTRVDQSALRAVGRMGGPRYTRTRDQFEMERPSG